MNLPKKSDHSHKEWNDSLGKQAELAVLRAYVENQATIETILIYRALKFKQTKEQDPYFYFFCVYYQFFFLFPTIFLRVTIQQFGKRHSNTSLIRTT